MNDTPPSILVVDDDVDTCRNLADILTDLGYDVTVAHDGYAALELVRQRPFDVALLDFKMPGMDGLELLHEVRKLRASTVALVVTAYASAETEERAHATGAWQVLSKPVDLSHLLALVSRAVGQPLVLVVDDDPDLCSNLWDLLRERGFRVGVANDLGSASSHLRDTRFQVVLIDMRLPDGSGDEVYHLVREVNPQARTVLITGHRDELQQHVEEVLREGADAVCYKPFDVPQLLSTLEALTRS
jgi:DNA-binding response OmpR family regulator